MPNVKVVMALVCSSSNICIVPELDQSGTKVEVYYC